MVQEELDQTQGELARLGSRIGELSGENESRRQQLEEKLQGYVPNEALEQEVWELLKKQSGQAVINRKKAQVADLEEKEQAQAETLRAARNRYILRIRQVLLMERKLPTRPTKNCLKNI